MKNNKICLAIFPILFAPFISCSSKLEENAYKSLRPSLLNPSSYKIISIEETSPIMFAENLEKARDFYETDMNKNMNALDTMLKDMNRYIDDYLYIETVDNLFKDLKLDSAMLEFLDREASIKTNNFVIGREYAYRFHAENEHGEIAPHLYYMYADLNDSVYYIEKERFDPILFDAIPHFRDTANYWIKKINEVEGE